MRFLRSGFALVSWFPVGITGNDAKRKAWVRTGEVGMRRWRLGGIGRPEWGAAPDEHQMELHRRFLHGSCIFQSHWCRKSASAVPDVAVFISDYCASE